MIKTDFDTRLQKVSDRVISNKTKNLLDVYFHANSWISKGLSNEKIVLLLELNVHL